MNRKTFNHSALFASLALTALIAGCGTSNKEGNLIGSVAKVDETSCAQCHGSAREKLTGDLIYEKYAASVHALNSVGCQDCHGGGAQHNGVGPIPYPKPSEEQCKTCHDTVGLVTKYTASKHKGAATEDGEEVCNRCHTHQGAVLAAKFGYTGDGTVMDAKVNAPGAIQNAEPIKCNTCHVTHDPKTLRVDAGWAPSTVVGAAVNTGNAQYKLCTQCHTYINPAGKLAASGTTASGTVRVGHHETSWYRVIATTHYDNPATPALEGYGVDTTGANPCFDCHGHESKTNTNTNDPTKTTYKLANATVYTDWALSGHARAILEKKYAAATANPVNTALPRTDPTRVAQGLAQVDAVTAATVDAGPFGGHNSGTCARCHSNGGFAYTMDNLANTPVAVAAGILKCNGCHTDPGAGTLRTLKGTKAATNYTTDLGWNPTSFGYALNYGKKAYPDVAASNLCISCHDSRQNDPGAITSTTTAYTRTHYLQAAPLMYVKMGFLNLSTGTAGTTQAYLDSLKSDQDGGKITSTHRKLGTPAIQGDSHNASFFVAGNLDSKGPCVVCHLAKGSHTLKIDQKAVNEVCSKCHDSEAGIDITGIAAFNEHFIEPQSEVYQDALQLAIDLFNSKNTGVTITPEDPGSKFVRPYLTADLTKEANAANLTAAGSSWTAVAAAGGYNRTKLLGAIGNIILFKSDPGGYAHARTYSRRLIYDTIDFLDDGVLNMSVSQTAKTFRPAKYTVGAKAYTTSATVGDKAPGTSESMLFLKGYNRTTGAWNTPERP